MFTKSRTYTNDTTFLLLASAILIFIFTLFNSALQVPLTGFYSNSDVATEKNVLPSLSDFEASILKDDNSTLPAGLYVPGISALPITQQPAGNPAYVTLSPNSVTQFSMVNQYNSIGILAHNFLAGNTFYDLSLDQMIILINGNGEFEFYIVKEIHQYQALSPQNPYSNFVNVNQNEGTITSTQLFIRIYAKENRLILQTCIEKDGNSSWGRHFVIAEKFQTT